MTLISKQIYFVCRFFLPYECIQKCIHVFRFIPFLPRFFMECFHEINFNLRAVSFKTMLSYFSQGSKSERNQRKKAEDKRQKEEEKRRKAEENKLQKELEKKTAATCRSE